MKYFTQQWYHDCQKHMIYFGLKISGEAEEYSDEYFQRLYQMRVNEYITDYLKWADEEQIKCLSAEEYALGRYSWRLIELNRLPTEIKDNIADIRVAALGFVTQDTLQKITAFCKKIDEQTEATCNLYWDYYEDIKDSIPTRIEKPLARQHDAHIKKIGIVDSDYIIETEMDGRDYTKKHIFHFKNASVEQNIVKSGYLTWLYEEIYLRNGEYEIHISFHNHYPRSKGNREIILSDVIICAEDIEIDIITYKPEYYEDYTEFL